MKNVIFIVSDAFRADRLSYFGYRRKGEKLTPNLDMLAEEGKVFKNAYSPGPWTKIAQPAILTGEFILPRWVILESLLNYLSNTIP